MNGSLRMSPGSRMITSEPTFAPLLETPATDGLRPCRASSGLHLITVPPINERRYPMQDGLNAGPGVTIACWPAFYPAA